MAWSPLRSRWWKPALAAALVAAGGDARAGSAFDQLVDACRQSGGNCNPSVPAVSPPSRQGGSQASSPARARAAPAPRANPEADLRNAVVGSLLESLLSSLFSGEPEGPSPEELARLEQQRIAEYQARAAAVAQQRAARDAQQASDLDAMAAAFSVGFDSPAPASGAVALSGTRPALFAPPANPLRAGAPPTAAAERLARMAAENQDVAALLERLDELAARLHALRTEADLVGRSAEARAQEFQAMEERVARGVADARERGVSMAFDGLLLGNEKALASLAEVQASGRAWRELKDLLRETHEGISLAQDAAEKVQQWSDDAAFALRQRELQADLRYLAERLGGPYGQLGSSIVSSAQTVREQLAVLHRQGELQGFEQGYRDRLARVRADTDALLAQLREVRAELAQRTGLKPSDIALPSAKPAGLASEVPPLVE